MNFKITIDFCQQVLWGQNTFQLKLNACQGTPKTLGKIQKHLILKSINTMGFRTLEINKQAEIHIKEGQLEVTTEDGIAIISIEDLSMI